MASEDDDDAAALQRIRYQAANVLNRVEARSSSPKQKRDKKKEPLGHNLLSSLKKNIPSAQALSASLQPLVAASTSFIATATATAAAVDSSTTSPKTTRATKKKPAAAAAAATRTDEDDDAVVAELSLPASPPRSIRLFGDQVILFSVILRDDIRLVRAQVTGLPTDAMDVVHGLLDLKPTVGWGEYPPPSTSSSWFSPIAASSSSSSMYEGLRFHVYEYLEGKVQQQAQQQHHQQQQQQEDTSEKKNATQQPKLRIWTFACVYDAEMLIDRRRVESFLEELVMVTAMPRETITPGNDNPWVNGEVDACAEIFRPLLENRMKRFKVTASECGPDTGTTTTTTTKTPAPLSSSKAISEIIESNKIVLERYEKKCAYLEAQKYAMKKQVESMKRAALALEHEQQKAAATTEAKKKQKQPPTPITKTASSKSDGENIVTDQDRDKNESLTVLLQEVMDETMTKVAKEITSKERHQQGGAKPSSSSESDQKAGGANGVTTEDNNKVEPKERGQKERDEKKKKKVPSSKDKKDEAVVTESTKEPPKEQEKQVNNEDKKVPSNEDEAAAVAVAPEAMMDEEILKEMERMNEEVIQAAAAATKKNRKVPHKESFAAEVQAGREHKKKKRMIPLTYLITAAVVVLVALLLAGIMQESRYPISIPETLHKYSHSMLTLFNNRTSRSGDNEEKGTEKVKGNGMKSSNKRPNLGRLFGKNPSNNRRKKGQTQ